MEIFKTKSTKTSYKFDFGFKNQLDFFLSEVPKINYQDNLLDEINTMELTFDLVEEYLNNNTVKKSKILVISDQFFPSIGSAANLMTELCEYLSLKGFEVFVLTSKPDRIPPDSMKELNENIKIKRIYIPFQKSSLYLFRGFFTLLAPLIYFFKVMLF